MQALPLLAYLPRDGNDGSGRVAAQSVRPRYVPGVCGAHGRGVEALRQAESYKKAGEVEERKRTVTEAPAKADTTGGRAYEAALYQLRGELLLTLLLAGEGAKT
jgi:hypothetical protein